MREIPEEKSNNDLSDPPFFGKKRDIKKSEGIIMCVLIFKGIMGSVPSY